MHDMEECQVGWLDRNQLLFVCIIVYNGSLKSSCRNSNIKMRQKSKWTVCRGERTDIILNPVTPCNYPHLSLSCSEFFSMLSFSANSISSLAARPMLTAVGRAEVR